MKKTKYHLYLADEERGKVIHSLINLKNNLIEQGKYTDAVDELICKFANAKRKKIKIKYV